jgi:hypothetical protein
VVRLFPLKVTSARGAIVFAEVNCHTLALEPWAKLARLIVVGVLLVRYLLITITVSAPSDERRAAKAERLSGFGTVACTLVSPNVDLLPS